MKIALVTTLEHGGPVEHVRLLAGELVAAGAEVRAIVGFESVAEACSGVGADPVLVPARSARSLRAAAAVARSCAGFDVVHSHDRRSCLWTLAPPHRSGQPARVHTLHGLPDTYLPLPDSAQRSSRLRDRLAYRVVEARLIGRADAVVVPSRATLDLATRLGYRMARAVIVPNGVIVPHGVDVGARLPPSDASIGMLAALEPVKGIEVFLRAACLVHDDDPSSRFVVFGSGSLLGTLEEDARQLGMADVVCFAGRTTSSVAFAQLSVLVVTSHFETSSMVVLEAMAAGVPVVATRVGGTSELAPPDTMLMIPPNDPTAAADAIRRTLGDREATRRRVARARAHVEVHRSAAATMHAMQEIYRSVVDRSGR